MKGLRGYAPGITTNPFPDNSGTFLPADVTFEFQVHYTPVGRKTVDSSKMGIWVLDEAPEHEIFTNTMINSRIKIPAGAKNHQEFDTMTVKKDSLFTAYCLTLITEARPWKSVSFILMEKRRFYCLYRTTISIGKLLMILKSQFLFQKDLNLNKSIGGITQNKILLILTPL